MAIEDWDVDLINGRASNGAFTVTFYALEDGGFSLGFLNGPNDLSERERFELIMDAMNAIHDRKYAD